MWVVSLSKKEEILTRFEETLGQETLTCPVRFQGWDIYAKPHLWARAQPWEGSDG